jgi:multiple sugar transport system permease protein
MGFVMTQKRISVAIFTLLALFVAAVWFLPLFWALSVSLRSKIETFTVTGLGIPFLQYRPTLENWREELASTETIRALLNSVVIAFSSSFLVLLIGTPAAYALARFRFNPKVSMIFSGVLAVAVAFFAIFFKVRWEIAVPIAIGLFLIMAFTFGRRGERTLGNEDLVMWFLSQRILPPIATLWPFLLMMNQLKLVGTHQALILAYVTFNLPFAIVIMRQAFLDLPVELEEAALVDGASIVGAFARVALRLAAPALAATLLIVIAFSWNEFLFALELGGRNAKTIPVQMAGAADTRGIQFWFVGVRTLIAVIPPTILALLAQRYIVQGLTFGAVKG